MYPSATYKNNAEYNSGSGYILRLKRCNRLTRLMSVNIIFLDLRPTNVSSEADDIFEVGAKYHPSMRAKSRRPSF